MRLLLATALFAAIATASIAPLDVDDVNAAAAASAPLPTVTLNVIRPEEPFLHHASVTVTWSLSGGEFDPVNDWVSSWWEPFPQSYVQFANVTGNTGSANFTLLNARHPFRFRYFRGNTSIAEAATVITPEAAYPMGIRVIFDPANASNAIVMWTSNRSVAGQTGVRFGTSPDALDRSAFESKTLTYTKEDFNRKVQLPPIPTRTTMFDNIAKRDLRCGWDTCYNDLTACELFVEPGLFHVVELTNLAPNTKYFYSAGELNGHMSVTRRFTSRIAPSADASISVLYVADAGAGFQLDGFKGSASHNACPVGPAFSTEGAVYVWDAIKADPLTQHDHISIMNGDISYARGWPYVWELFHNETEDIFGQLPVLVTYGNHEYDWGSNPYQYARGPDGGGECGIATGQRFNIENEDRPWFIMSNGPATFVQLSSEHDPVAQSTWLRQVLPLVNRTETPWLIVSIHRPLYESNNYFSWDLTMQIRAEYDDVFVQYGVDAVLQGHAHYYERMCSISNGACATWGYRDVWTQYNNVNLTNAPASCKQTGTATYLAPCKIECAKTANCTGVIFDDKGYTCTLLTCEQPFSVDYSFGHSVWSMERRPGQPPIYIVDGTAGGVFTPVQTPNSPWTMYKDFERWGYSRLQMNATSLNWKHHHIDGSIVDEVTLTK